jgi:putative peptide zinc metalloprotease protein
MSTVIALDDARRTRQRETAQPLPSLRQELSLYAGAVAADGAPTWSLHDPTRNQFFRIDWLTFEIVARWSLRSPEAIVESVSNETTLQIEVADVEAVRAFVIENQLCQTRDAVGTASLLSREQATHSSLWQWLLHHYLFFRIPLWRPDAWLTRYADRVGLFYSKRFFQLTGVVLIAGVFGCIRQWPQFSASLLDTFSFEGILGYAGALAFVKVLHEFGHAFTAKRKGCRVPTMGLAFLVMWPVAYTDVNEVWKLRDHKDRFAVGAAGIVTELVVAAWATLAWVLLPDGSLRTAAFLLATTTWISTVAINASPFMRFDGYFLLSDLLDFPNLHARSFALARWDLREKLFGLGEPVPEALPPARHKGLIIFAWLVWLYRLTLFLGIAMLVYHFFIKVVGVLLFAVEIVYFVALPVWREIQEWRKRSAAIKISRRARKSLAAFGVLFAIACVPWNTHINGQGMLRTTRHFSLYAPEAAQLIEVPVGNGARIEAGQSLMTLASPDLDHRELRSRNAADLMSWQLEISGLDEELRAKHSITRERLVSAETELAGLSRQQARMVLQAPFAGILVDVAPALAPGVWVSRQEKLGELIDPTGWAVEMYLHDADMHRVKVGDGALFFPEAPGKQAIELTVVSIDADATRQLLEPMLAVQHGGELATRDRNGQLIPEKALYRVTLRANMESLGERTQFSERGHAVIYGERKSLLGDFLRNAFNVLIRESGW